MPVVTMIAGPNGSGKTTLTRELVDRGIDLGDYFNADDIAAELSGPPEEIAVKAQAEVRMRRARALADSRDHCFETVMSHVSHIQFLLDARAQGFTTRLYFVATDDPSINKDRVANRVAHGGHDVPSDRIEKRYYSCLGNLPAAIKAADYALIFDNTFAADPLRELAEIDSGKLRHLRGKTEYPNLPDWWLTILAVMNASSNLLGGLGGRLP